jgi:hypothetical protein
MRLYIDESATLFTGGEHYYSIDESKESVILTHTYVKTGVMLSATLTFDNVAGFAV